MLISILVVAIGLNAQIVTTIVYLNNGKQPVEYKLENSIASIQEFVEDDMRMALRKQTLEYIIFEYNGNEIASIYGEDPDSPFYSEYRGETDENYRLDRSIEWVFEMLNAEKYYITILDQDEEERFIFYPIDLTLVEFLKANEFGFDGFEQITILDKNKKLVYSDYDGTSSDDYFKIIW